MDEEALPQVRELYEEVQRLTAALRDLGSPEWGLHKEVRRHIVIVVGARPVALPREVVPWDEDW